MSLSTVETEPFPVRSQEASELLAAERKTTKRRVYPSAPTVFLTHRGFAPYYLYAVAAVYYRLKRLRALFCAKCGSGSTTNLF